MVNVAISPKAIAQKLLAKPNESLVNPMIEIVREKLPSDRPTVTQVKVTKPTGTAADLKPNSSSGKAPVTPSSSSGKDPIESVNSSSGKVPTKPTGENGDDTNNDSPSNLEEKLDNREDTEQADLLKGDLPCLDSKPECIAQLQGLAIANSPDIKALDTQIASSGEAVKLAAVQGRGSFAESISPWVSAIAPILLQNSRPFATGELRTSLESRLIFEALPLIISGRATSDSNQTRNSQANADLQIKLAQLEKTKVEITIALRGKVADEVIKFENIKDESNLQSIIVKRETARAKLIEIAYRMGESDTISQIARLNDFDRKKIIAAQSKSRLRSQALKIQRLVKGSSEN
jgi:hypothetical protein